MYADTRTCYPSQDHLLPWTDWMNALQCIPEKVFGPVLVTLNPPLEPDPKRVVGRYQYDHPILGSKVPSTVQPNSDRADLSFI